MSDDARARFDAIREDITANDIAIVGLVNERLRLVTALWELKRVLELDTVDPDRERRLRAHLAELNAGPLSADGLDGLVTSLLERGWLNASRTGADDARLAFGPHARFWVEPGREEEFARVGDATRCAWAWRRYVRAAQVAPDRTVTMRYEDLVADPAAVAVPVAARLGVPVEQVAEVLGRVHDRSAGRWQRDLTDAQVAEVEDEAGDLLAELGYALRTR